MGASFKVNPGDEVRITLHVSGNVVTDINDTTYTFRSGVILTTAADYVRIQAETVGADFRVDDICAIKLMGNPNDDAYGDLSEELSTSGFTVTGIWTPDEDATDISTTPVIIGR